MKKMVRGDLTVMLSLVFLLLLGFVGAVLESASIQVTKNEKRTDAARAIESVFAEYQRDLFDRYHIFAIDGSYETGDYSENNILNRLSYYGAENIDLDIKEIRYLTDKNGKAFFEQAVQYEKEKTGVNQIEHLLGNMEVLETYNDKWDTYEKDNSKTSEQLDQMLLESEQQLSNENNPLSFISDIRREGLLKSTLPENFSVSNGSILLSDVPSGRENQTGAGEWSGREEQVQDTIFFNLYLMENFKTAREAENNAVLAYEIEYLIAGKSSDKENLESVVTTLCNLRFAADYMYLLTDSAKQAEARALAGTICALLTVPGITEIAAQAILFAWAYGEAIQDVKALLAGEKVSLWKNATNWKLSLDNLLQLNEGESLSGRGDADGLSYETYLRMLLFMKDKVLLSMRALDLVEININLMKESSFFRVDLCITGIRAEGTCELRRGVTYQFVTKYQYQ